MRKIAIVLTLLVVFSLLTSAVFAREHKYRQSQFMITVGGFTDDGFEWFYWTAGAEMNLFLGNNLMITPEAMFIGYEFDFDWFWLHAGGTANILFGKRGHQMFAGGGLVLAIPIEPSGADTDLMLKLNGGFLTKNMKLTAYIITPFDDIFGYMNFGVSVGFMLF